jgi:hypothetical protein
MTIVANFPAPADEAYPTRRGNITMKDTHGQKNDRRPTTAMDLPN